MAANYDAVEAPIKAVAIEGVQYEYGPHLFSGQLPKFWKTMVTIFKNNTLSQISTFDIIIRSNTECLLLTEDGFPPQVVDSGWH